VVETSLIGVMRLELSTLLTNPDLQVADTNYHVKVPVFDPKLMQRSEFIYRNQLIQLKENDLIMMNDALKQSEEEEAKRIAAEKAAMAQTQSSMPTGKKPDPKAAAAAKGKDAKKGAPAVDDPNSPKEITIDYPECPALPDYVVIDRTYK